MSKAKCLSLLHKYIVLPDSYSIEISEKDISLVSLCKNNKVIEQFILENYDTESIIELGLEIGEIIDIQGV